MRALTALLCASMLTGMAPELSAESPPSPEGAYCAINGLRLSRANMTLHAPSPKAERLLQSIVDRVGIQNDFSLKAATFHKSTPMAFADIKGGSVRRIVYDRDIFTPDKGLDFTFAAVLAHEVGHHLASDISGVNRPNHTEELRADFFGGYIVNILGGSEAGAIAVTRHFGAGSDSHPPREKREEAFRSGWQHGETMRQPQRQLCVGRWVGEVYRKGNTVCRSASICGFPKSQPRTACLNDEMKWVCEN